MATSHRFPKNALEVLPHSPQDGISIRPSHALERLTAYFMSLASLVPLGNSQYRRLSLASTIPLIPVVLCRWFRGPRKIELALLVVASIMTDYILVTRNVGTSRSWDSWASASAHALVLILAAVGLMWARLILGSKRSLRYRYGPSALALVVVLSLGVLRQDLTLGEPGEVHLLEQGA